MKINRLIKFVLGMAVATMIGCGGGGGSSLTPTTPPPTATKAIVALTTTDASPAGLSIGAISSTVTYSTNKGLSITDADVVASGVAAGSTVAANVSTAGQVRIGLITVTPFPIGQYATLTFSFAAGSPITAGDFSVALNPANNDQIISASGSPISGANVAILSVTFQ
jgi:hypothetical protein